MADEEKLNARNNASASTTTEASIQRHQSETKSWARKGVKWAVLALLALFTLDGMVARVLMPDRYYPTGIQAIKRVWMERAREKEYRGYVEARNSVTEEKARRMLMEGKMRTVIDGHNDLPYLIRMLYGNHIYDESFDFMNLPGHVDGKRLEESNVLGTFWSVFVECPKSDFDEDGVEFGDTIYAAAVKETFQQVDLVTRLIAKEDYILSTATSPYGFGNNFDHARHCWFQDGANQEEIDKCLFQEIFSPTDPGYDVDWEAVVCIGFGPPGWLASVMGAEGLHQIGNSVANLRALYGLGVRYMTLTHGCNNRYADSATAPGGPRWGGLSREGREIVKEMNRLGMLVDLSHVSADVMRDVLGGVTMAPVMFSHSSAFALCPHPRNVPDDVLHLVKKNNGVVMVNFYPQFVSCGPGKVPANATIGMVADHIEYIGKLIGWEHVGIGSDFDGIDSVPAGLEDVSKYPDLTAELVKRGVKAIDVVKVMGLNILRVWKAVEIVAEQMQVRGALPMEDKLPKRELDFAGGVVA